MITEEFFTLADGGKIPKLGFGTWMIPDSEAEEAVKNALAVGYRHIDTAQAYRNEVGVGAGVRNSGIKREDVFVTTKVAAEHKSYEAAAASIDESLKKSGLDYFDLIIIHSPQPWAEFRGEKRYFEENRDVWRALEDAKSAGKAKHIGVSNFLEDDLENILSDCRERPQVNQILIHIGNTPQSLISYCNEHKILPEAYSPIAHGEALKSMAVAAMAEKYGVSVAQLCIKYCLELGAVTLPKAISKEHIRQNADVDFALSAEDFEMLRNIESIKDYGEYSHFPVFSKKEQI